MSILYITQNGVTSHIGRSQVAPYVLGLAQQGFKIHLLSSEPVADPRLVEHYQQLFSDAGVTWTRVPYRNRPPIIGPLLTQWRLRQAARRIVADGEIKVVHCRSFPPAVIGHALKRQFGTKFIFDFRDFYADWGLQHTRGVKWLLYGRMKQLEGPMIRAADKVVCLTNRATEVLADWYLKDHAAPMRMFQVIPCCADFEHFDTAKLPAAEIAAVRERIGIEPGAFVMLYLGSLGTDYLLPHMMALFRQVMALKPSARFLFVSNNGQALIESECRTQGIPRESIRFVSVDRNETPLFIALADLSVVFIRADLSKAGSFAYQACRIVRLQCAGNRQYRRG